MAKLKQLIDKTSKNKHKTITLGNQPSLQIDPLLSQPNKIIKHKSLSSNSTITVQSLIHNNKSDIYQNYYNNKLKHILKPIIKNINLIYNTSLYASKNTPINIYIEDIDKTNTDPNFYYDNQKKKYQTDNETLGYTARIGKHDSKHMIISQIAMHSNVYHIPIFLHEVGHIIDMISNHDKNYMSDNADFNNLIDLYVNKLNSSKYTDLLSEKYKNYLSEPTEIFARYHAAWYDHEIQRYSKAYPNALNPFDQNSHIPIQTMIGEKLAYELYKDHPEIQQFFTKHFGGLIPPENTKLFNKEKWDELHTHQNTISDQSLMSKLKQSLFNAGVSLDDNNIKQNTNDIEYD